MLDERQAAPRPDEAFGPLVVGFVVREGAPPPDRFTSELERESIQLAPASFPAPGSATTPDVRIVLVWLPAGVPLAELADVAAWRDQTAVVGCAPTGTTEDSERALAAGFDDFVAGRAAPREMARRLRAVERRTRRSHSQPSRERFGRIRLDAAQHRLWVDGRRVPLTRTELAVMTTLVDAAGQIRTRADILLKAWGDEGLEVGERAVDNIIMRLRRKLPDPDLIVTVRGVGFRLADR
jgi:two-component system, OmpR family, phosphate regulon response regulator PhoB